MAEHARLGESSKMNEEDLKSCQEEKKQLILELQKWDAEKTRLEGKVFELSEEKKRLAAALEKSAGDLEKDRAEVERRSDELKRISALFPDLAEGSDLAEVIDDLKAAAAQEYDKGFEAALEKLKVLYPDADVGRFDIDKVVVNGQIVDQEAPAADTTANLDLTALDTFLNDEDMVGHINGAGGDAVGPDMTDARTDPE